MEAMTKHVTLHIRWQRFEAYDGSASCLTLCNSHGPITLQYRVEP